MKIYQACRKEAQREKQKEIEAKLKSGEVIIKGGSIIPSQIWIEEKPWAKEREKFELENQAVREEWKRKQRFKQNDQAWQEEWTRLERCLAELERRS